MFCYKSGMNDILVTAEKSGATTGTVRFGGRDYPCTLGRGGIVAAAVKREGDGATPAGRFPLREVYYRADRLACPVTKLSVLPLEKDFGWCEVSDHHDYNKLVRIPHPAMTDHMTRDDHIYDIVVVVGYNDAPVEPGKGSGIFIHLAQPDFSPTAGCVGLALEHLQEILLGLDPQSRITILQPKE